jgi:hypothetical protein
MATRKKKTEIIESADLAEMINIPSNGWPKINQGSHLTVKTFENGRTELIWDDEALARDVRGAIASLENLTQGELNGKTKKTRKSK